MKNSYISINKVLTLNLPYMYGLLLLYILLCALQPKTCIHLTFDLAFDFSKLDVKIQLLNQDFK